MKARLNSPDKQRWCYLGARGICDCGDERAWHKTPWSRKAIWPERTPCARRDDKIRIGYRRTWSADSATRRERRETAWTSCGRYVRVRSSGAAEEEESGGLRDEAGRCENVVAGDGGTR